MTSSDVQFRKQRQVVQLESWYFNPISEQRPQLVATRKLQPTLTKKTLCVIHSVEYNYISPSSTVAIVGPVAQSV